jgi:hypothetical protein
MQRKQQVGECWVCVIFFAWVCVWARQIRQLRLTIPTTRALSCASGVRYLATSGSLGLTGFGTTPPNFFFGWFFLFLAQICKLILD